MKYRTILSTLVTLTLAFAAHADVKSDIGYTELKAEFGNALPDGSNVTALQVEGFDSAGNWRPSSASGLAYLQMSYPINPTVCSGSTSHATTVANYLASSSTSILPRLHELKVASYTLYSTMSLRAGMFDSPKPATWDLENHSYVATNTVLDLINLQVMDYRINRDLVTVLVGLANDTSVLPPLWGNSYNTITVGTATGRHSRGGTNLEVAGRMKPDLVGTATYCSYTTPIVASAAGVLIGETKRTAALAAAKDPRTIKALLLAGATKEEFATWSQTSAHPLDPIYGAGQVNINHSYRMLIAGRQSTGAAWRSLKGWNLGQSGTNAVYYFEVPAGRTLKFSTVLTWHRNLANTYGNFWGLTSTLADLNLRLRNSNTSYALGTVVAESTSSLDNVEHIYRTALPAGRYALEVSGPAGTVYGIAWNGILSGSTGTPAVPVIVVVAPSITAQPCAASVIEGQSANFSVSATGSGLSYQWSKSGTAIAGATASSYTIATTLSCAGSYTVAVSNSAGSVVSSTATLTVAARPVTEPPSSAPATLTPTSYSARGQNGTLEGVAKLFDSKTTTKWLDFNGSSWIRVSFAAAQSLTSYSLTSANDCPERDPASWTLSGSNNGTTWTVIETRSGQVFASRYLKRDFALTQASAAYRQFRLATTAKSGAITQLAELAFSGAALPVVNTPPAATVELAPSSYSARGQNGVKEGIAKLFDHSTKTKWLDFSGTTWVQVTFTSPRALDAYSLTSGNDVPERDPGSWTLSGSNNGTTWTVIESRSGQTWSSRKLTRDFVLDQTSSAYVHYRIDMRARSGAITQLAELEFSGR